MRYSFNGTRYNWYRVSMDFTIVKVLVENHDLNYHKGDFEIRIFMIKFKIIIKSVHNSKDHKSGVETFICTQHNII